MKITADGWLEAVASGLPAVVRVPSVRTTTLDAGPLGVVWHWTGGPARGPAFATALANEIRTFDKAKDRAASWHVLVAKDGRLLQSVPFTHGSWHVGRPGRIGVAPVKTNGAWDPTAWGGRLFANINRATVGVELENSGELVKVDGKFYCWPFYLDPDQPNSGPDPRYEVAADRALLVDGKFYDAFPQPQLDAAKRLIQALALRFKLGRAVCQYGHLMFDPARKTDPGPLWLDRCLPELLDGVFGKM